MKRSPLSTALLVIASILSWPVFLKAQKVQPEDESSAIAISKSHKEDNYAALDLSEEYSFEQGRNEMKQPVVTAIGRETANFIALKDIASFQYFQSYNQFVELRKFKLYSKNGSKYAPVNQRAFDRAMTNENIFFDDNRVQFYNISLNKTGQVAQVETEQQYKDSKYLTRVFFHSYFPIKERTIKFIVPDWLDLEFKEINFNGYKVEKSRLQEGKNTIYSFTLRDLDAVKSENNAIGIAYTHPHIIIMVKSYKYEGTQHKGFQEVADLYKWYNFLYSKSGNDVSSIKAQVEQVIKGKSSDIEKVKALFYWVQDNIRYIAFEDGYAGFIPDAVQNVFKNKYGDCKGMANLLTEMLKLAGLDAHFTWIGTRNIPYDHMNTPAMCVDNHAISTLYLNGKEYFLDATESYIPFGENAYRIQGKSALIQKGENFDVKYVPVPGKDANKVYTRASLNLIGNALKGHVKVVLTGNMRTDFHQMYQELPTEKQQEFIKSFVEFGNDNLNASKLVTSDLQNRELPVTIEADVDLSNNVTAVNNDVFASIDFFPKTLQRFMPDEKRQKGFSFESMFTYEDDIELTIPADKKFIDLPESVKLNFPDYAFHGSYTATSNKINLKKILAIQNGQVNKNDFSNWIGFLKKMKDFNSNQVSITKK